MSKPAACIRQKQGSGRPLVLVHGSGTDGTRWASVLPLLAAKFAVYAIDRRGHGHAARADEEGCYRIEQEFADLTALVAALPEGAVMIGHSYGALCALGAGAAGAHLDGLILYEPPLPASPAAYCPSGLIEAMREAIDRGDLETAAAAFARDVLRMSTADIERRRRLGLLGEMAAGARITLRELENVHRYAMGAARFASCDRPTILLVGERSSAEYHDTARSLSAVLPASQVVLLQGQGHGAIDAAPDVFAARVIQLVERSLTPRPQAG
jgi:pimeloyl-ACP methyl ester carboxylesterase